MSCEIKFAHAHVRARSHVCDVRAKRLSKCACDVRACGHFSCVRRAIAISHVFRTFLGKKRPNLGLLRLLSIFFHGPTFFDFAWNGNRCIKKYKICFKIILYYKRACAIRILEKRTRACDVRAAENRVCECACVRGKKSSQLTVWIYVWFVFWKLV